MITDTLGYVAASLVFATFCAQRMASLRALAIASNVAFIGYGYLDSLWPILILHCAMLPINIVRCRQSMRGSGDAAPVGAIPSTPRTAPPQPASYLSPRVAIGLFRQLRSWTERKGCGACFSRCQPAISPISKCAWLRWRAANLKPDRAAVIQPSTKSATMPTAALPEI